MKILLSPCFQMFDEKKGGSDPLVAFAVGNGIATRFPESVVVTGFKELVNEKPYKIVELNKSRNLDLSIFGSLTFNLKYTLASIYLSLKYPNNLVHHVLPFWPGRTYNLFAILFNCFGKPFVIGPVFKPVQRYEEFKKQKLQIYRENIKQESKLEDLGQRMIKLFAKPLGLLSKLTMQKATRIIATDQATKDLIVNLGINPDKIKVINPGVLIERFKYIPFNQKFDGTLRFLAVGYLIERKGFDLILKALAKFDCHPEPENVEGEGSRDNGEILRSAQNDTQGNKKNKDMFDWNLRIVGSGPEMESLIELASELKIDDKVTFAGFIDNIDLHIEYENAHIFLNMSKDEGFATTALEASAAGLPIISSKVGGFNDVVRTGRNGFLVEQGNYKEMSDKILDLTMNHGKIQEFGRYSRKLAEKEYDWEKIIDKYVEVYKQIVN